MDILITGVNGFLGKNIANVLAKSGHKIIGLGKKESSDLECLSTYHSVSVLDKQSLKRFTCCLSNNGLFALRYFLLLFNSL